MVLEKKRRIQDLDNKTFILHESLTPEERKEYDELSYDVIAWETKKKFRIREEQEKFER